MTYLVPSLVSLSRPLVGGAATCVLLAAVAAPAAAEVISDDASKITIFGWTQVRADWSRGAAVNPATGDRSSYSPGDNGIGQADPLDFSIRRLRLGVRGTFANDYPFQVTLQGDGIGNPGGANNGGTVTVFDAFAGRRFVAGDLIHTVTAGKQAIWAQPALFRAIGNMFPTSRNTAALFAYNGVGARYFLEAPAIRFAVDVQNAGATNPASTGSSDDNASATQARGEGLLYVARLELTGVGDSAAPWQETFAGKPGTGFVVALDAGMNKSDRTTVVAGPPAVLASETSKLLGAEAMVHVDGLTAVAWWRQVVRERDLDVGANPTDAVFPRQQKAFGAQAGYAFGGETMSFPIEPALRWERLDLNADVVGDTVGAVGGNIVYGAPEWGNSGTAISAGLNAYFMGNKNKIGLEFIRWESETPAGQNADNATANIIRLQHQLVF